MKPIQVLSQEATTRYLTDPEFHARALIACSMVEATATMEGFQIHPDARAGLLQAVVFGLIVSETPTEEIAAVISAQDAVNSMKSTAAAMGMTVSARPGFEVELVTDFPAATPLPGDRG